MNRPVLPRLATLAVLLFACGNLLDHYDARAPDVPFVDQINPAGRDAFYNGTENCGPAILAGIAKAHGKAGNMNDAELINLLALMAGTGPGGTTGNGMIAALTGMGMESDASAGADLDWIDEELSAGHDVIANGDYYAVPGRENPNKHSGHYIVITAVKDGWSTYKVMDPADPKVTWMTEAQLEKFIDLHPQGGFTISAW